jgi:hypothetical protein
MCASAATDHPSRRKRETMPVDDEFAEYIGESMASFDIAAEDLAS